MRAILTLAAGAVALAVTLGPAAAELPGQRTPEFGAAVELWLADDEATALGELARLAAAGNVAAQMLLALIDRTPALQGPWLARLPRDQRIALMRAPGGMSGTNWMQVAAEVEPSAALWLRMWDVGAPAELALDFARLGEARAARQALIAVAAREGRGLAAIAADPDYPRALLSLAWQERPGDPALAAAVAKLHPGDPQRETIGAEVDPAARVDWLETAPEAAPVAAFCARQCSETAAACALAAASALGSYRLLLVFGSPSERLIPAETFVQSPRGQAALLRRVLLNVDARGRRMQIARAEAQDACFAGLLEAEAQRYIIKRD